VVVQIRHQRVHRHSVDPCTAFVLPHALQRPCEIAALDNLKHQIVVS